MSVDNKGGNYNPEEDFGTVTTSLAELKAAVKEDDVRKTSKQGGDMGKYLPSFDTAIQSLSDYVAFLNDNVAILRYNDEYYETFVQELERIEGSDFDECMHTLIDMSQDFKNSADDIRGNYNVLSERMSNFARLIFEANNFIVRKYGSKNVFLTVALSNVKKWQSKEVERYSAKDLKEHLQKSKPITENAIEDYKKLLIYPIISRIDDTDAGEKAFNRAFDLIMPVEIDKGMLFKKFLNELEEAFRDYSVDLNVLDEDFVLELKDIFDHYFSFLTNFLSSYNKNIFSLYEEIDEDLGNASIYIEDDDENTDKYRKYVFKYRFFVTVKRLIDIISKFEFKENTRDKEIEQLKRFFRILDVFDTSKSKISPLNKQTIPPSFLRTYELRAIRLLAISHLARVQNTNEAWRAEEFKKLEKLYMDVLSDEAALTIHTNMILSLIEEGDFSSEFLVNFIKQKISEIEKGCVIRDQKTGKIMQLFEPYMEEEDGFYYQMEVDGREPNYAAELVSHSESKVFRSPVSRAYRTSISAVARSPYIPSGDFPVVNGEEDTHEEDNELGMHLDVNNLESILAKIEIPRSERRQIDRKILKLNSMEFDDVVLELKEALDNKNEYFVYYIIKLIGDRLIAFDDEDFMEKYKLLEEGVFNNNFTIKEYLKRSINYYLIWRFVESRTKNADKITNTDNFIANKMSSILNSRDSFERFLATWRPTIKHIQIIFDSWFEKFPELNELLQNQIHLLSWDIGEENKGRKPAGVPQFALDARRAREEFIFNESEDLRIQKIRKQLFGSVFAVLAMVFAYYGISNYVKSDVETVLNGSISESQKTENDDSEDLTNTVEQEEDLSETFKLMAKYLDMVDTEKDAEELWRNSTESERKYLLKLVEERKKT